MAFFTFNEIIDIIGMSAFIGFIFMDYIKLKANEPKLESFKRAVIALSPAIILHELAHKFVAMSFGLDAIFEAFYRQTFTLGLGVLAILAKLSNFGFVFLVPGYVRICDGSAECAGILASNPLIGSIIAFSGPAIHLAFFGLSILMLRKKKLSDNQTFFWSVNKKINLFLFILNMLPIPGIDGWQVYQGIIGAFS